MTVSFSEHLELLVLHGRAAVASLELSSPELVVPPHGEPAHQIAVQLWQTLEVWGWSLENLTAHWRQRKEPKPPVQYPALATGIAAEISRMESVLRRVGPDVGIDYFGRPGTTAEVARLLAHEAIGVAHAVGLAAGRTPPTQSPVVANDGIDQGLCHWQSPQDNARWRSETVAIRTLDTGGVWHLELAGRVGSPEEEFRLVSPTRAAVVVEGPAVSLLWWLHGHPTPEDAVEVSGSPETIRALRSVLLHPVDEKPRLRRWFDALSRRGNSS